jgi:hypothetical protein
MSGAHRHLPRLPDAMDVPPDASIRCPACNHALGGWPPALLDAAYIVAATVTCPACRQQWTECRGQFGRAGRVWTPAA